MDDNNDFGELRNAIERLTRNQEESNRRLEAIEAALQMRRKPELRAEPDIEVGPPGMVTPPSFTLPPRKAAEAPRTGFETKLGLTWINRIGAITLILGIAFFFKYAVENQWIGETARVLLGILAGLSTLEAGDYFWRRDQKVFAQGITGTGVAILYLAFYAAFGFYHLWPQALVLVLLAGTTAAACALALRYSALAIAALGLLGGYAAPVLLSTENSPWILLSGVALLNVGALWLARRENWRVLEAIAGAGTVFLYLGWLLPAHEGKEVVATLFLVLFYAMFVRLRPFAYFVATQLLAAWAIFAIFHNHHPEFVLFALALIVAGLVIADRFELPGAPPVVLFGCGYHFVVWRLGDGSLGADELTFQIIFAVVSLGIFVGWIPWKLWIRARSLIPQDLLTLGASGIFCFGALYAELSPKHHDVLGLVALLMAALYFGLSYWLRVEAGARVVSAAAGIVFVTLAIPIQFGGYTIAMSWALEGALLVWLGRRFEHDQMTIMALIVFGLSLWHLFFVDFEMFAAKPEFALIWNPRFVTGVVVGCCILFGAYWMREGVQRLGTWLAGHAALLVTLGVEVSVWAQRNSSPDTLTNVESAAESILVTAYAVILVAIGVSLKSLPNRILGLILIGMVILKLYFYDVWQLMRIYRIVAFVALGVLLLGASYIYSRRSHPQEKQN